MWRLNKLPPQAGNLLEAVLYRGEIARAEVAGILRLTPRHARRIASSLIERSAHIQGTARAAAARLPCRAGVALDAGTFSGTGGIGVISAARVPDTSGAWPQLYAVLGL